MPSSFASFSNGDVVEASHVAEMHAPIQNLERGAAFYAGTTGGSSTAYSATLSPAPDNPYQAGMIVNFKIHADNTAGSPDVTLNVNGVGAKPILKGGGDSLAAGDLKAGQMASVVYDSASGGAFKLVGGSSVGDLDDLTDVAISSPSTGQVVRYNGSQFVNANLAAGDMPSGIDASKIGSGAVSDTEFGYLDGVTSAIQTQINGKAASSHNHAASDINSGQIALAQGGTNANLSATGGTGQFLKQSSAGAAITVGALAASDMPSGIDASKIGGGAVSDTEFGYLDGVTSAIQTQINGKAASSHNHAASDINSGQMALAQGGTNANLSATGGSGQFLKQSSAGAAITVGVLAASDMPSGIDASKIGGGAVSNTEFGYLDGVTSAIQTQINTLTTAKVPIGAVSPYAGSSAPSGWLLCYGQNVSRTTYSALFSAISTTFGSGDGSTTFTLPDLRGRVAAGKDNMGGSSASRLVNMVSGGTLGASGGAERHQLSTGEMPAHTHSIATYSTGGGGGQVIQGGWAYNNFGTWTSSSTGGDGYHTNTQPTIVLNYITSDRP